MTDYNQEVIKNSKEEIKKLEEKLAIELEDNKTTSRIIQDIISLQKGIYKRGGHLVLNPLVAKANTLINKRCAEAILKSDLTIDDLTNLKLDYVNNFITVERFAEVNRLDIEIAHYIINTIEV